MLRFEPGAAGQDARTPSTVSSGFVKTGGNLTWGQRRNYPKSKGVIGIFVSFVLVMSKFKTVICLSQNEAMKSSPRPSTTTTAAPSGNK